MPTQPASGDPFEALGDPNRRQILRLLGAGDQPVQALAGSMPISRPAVSRHLRLLKQAGLVTEQAQGTRRIWVERNELGWNSLLPFYLTALTEELG